jgi:hypothetical protein
MVEIREKGEPPRYGAKVSKQDYYICLAKRCLLDVRKMRRLFLSGLWTRFENNLNFI